MALPFGQSHESTSHHICVDLVTLGSLLIIFTWPEFEKSQFAEFTHEWCFVIQPSPKLLEINSRPFEAASIALQWHDFDIDDHRQLVGLQKIRLGEAKRAQTELNQTLASVRKYVAEPKVRRERTPRSSQSHAQDQKLVDTLNRVHQLTE